MSANHGNLLVLCSGRRRRGVSVCPAGRRAWVNRIGSGVQGMSVNANKELTPMGVLTLTGVLWMLETAEQQLRLCNRPADRRLSRSDEGVGRHLAQCGCAGMWGAVPPASFLLLTPSFDGIE